MMGFLECNSQISEFLLFFVIDFLMAFVIIRFFYYPISKNRDYFFSFLVFNVIVFFIIGLFRSIELSVGFGFGIFALFSLLRYRTDMIPVREMSYLFIMIGLAFIHSLTNSINMGWVELGISNAVILLVLLLLEKGLKLNYERSKTVIYEKIENVKQEKREEMLKDLKDRTGLDITRYRIDRIDYLRDVVNITVFFRENGKA